MLVQVNKLQKIHISYQPSARAVLGEYRLEVENTREYRPRADILPVRSRASLVNKRFIIRLKKALKFSSSERDTSAGSFGTMPGLILREY